MAHDEGVSNAFIVHHLTPLTFTLGIFFAAEEARDGDFVEIQVAFHPLTY